MADRSKSASDHAPGSDAKASPDVWQEISGVAHQQVRTRGAKGAEFKTRLDVYFDQLSIQGMQGDINAIKEMNEYRNYLDGKNKLDEPKYSEGRERIKRAIERQNDVKEVDTPLFSLLYLETVRTLERDYKEKHGQTSQLLFSKPYYVDTSIGEDLIKRSQRSLAKKRGRSEPDVGYCKPPVGTRYKPGQSGNPTGQRKRQTDELTPIRDSLVKKVPALVEGRKTKLTSIAIITRRLFELATKGDPRARRELRKLLTELANRGLLKRPATRPRRRRKPRDKEVSSAFTIVYDAACCDVRLSIKEEMEEDFAKVYGSDPNFRADIERERQRAHEVISAYLAAKKRMADA